MSDPNDPHDDFPEVIPAGPASTELPQPEEVVYDTGSDAWWRAQAAAQKAAAEGETPPPTPEPTPTPYVAPPPLVEPTVLLPPFVTPPGATPPAAPPPLNPPPVATPPAAPPASAQPSPLDAAWESNLTRPEPEPEPEPQPEPIWAATPAEAVVDPSPDPASDVSYTDVPRERPAPPAAPVSPLQAAAGAAIAVVGVALAIGALFVFNHKDDTGSPAIVLPSVRPSVVVTKTTAPTPTATPSAAPTATAVPPVAAAPVVPLSVLNNSKIKGLASQAATRFKAGGWPVPVQGNYRGGTIATTTVYFAPGQQASAERFAKQFGIPRVAPRFPGLPTTGMTVVLTRDYR